MRIKVKSIYLHDVSASLRTNRADDGEWDTETGVIHIGDLVLPLGAVREFQMVVEAPLPVVVKPDLPASSFAIEPKRGPGRPRSK